jgi:2-polyprenyl-3-methyl-5-hydroxy-6-metoxy-1,4-benzoquinol methylase
MVQDFWKPIKREENVNGVLAMDSHLSNLRIKSILDCSCGLGFKTILLAELGYEVEGSNAGAIAVEYAYQLVKEEGLNIRFFSLPLGRVRTKCKRKFDYMFGDAFDWITTRKSRLQLRESILCLRRMGFLYSAFLSLIPKMSSPN